MEGLTARLMPTAPMQILLKNRMARLHMSTTAHVVRAKARGDAQYAMARDEPYRVGDVISVWYHALSAAQAANASIAEARVSPSWLITTIPRHNLWMAMM